MLKGQCLIIINPHASLKEKIRILSEAVKQFDLDQIYLPPVLRELLDSVPAHRPFSMPDDSKIVEGAIDIEE